MRGKVGNEIRKGMEEKDVLDFCRTEIPWVHFNEDSTRLGVKALFLFA